MLRHVADGKSSCAFNTRSYNSALYVCYAYNAGEYFADVFLDYWARSNHNSQRLICRLGAGKNSINVMFEVQQS